jgi:hypothetical protein
MELSRDHWSESIDHWSESIPPLVTAAGRDLWADSLDVDLIRYTVLYDSMISGRHSSHSLALALALELELELSERGWSRE